MQHLLAHKSIQMTMDVYAYLENRNEDIKEQIMPPVKSDKHDDDNNKILGLVLRATKQGDHNKILTILSPGGLVSAMAYGSRRVKSPLVAAANAFCYAEFTLKKSGKGSLPAIHEANIIESFYNLRLSLEKLELASEICKIAESTSFENLDSSAPLQFLLNTLHIIQTKPDTEIPKISAFFRLRYYALLGFEVEPQSQIISETGFLALEHIYTSPVSRLYNAQISSSALTELQNLANGVSI